MDTKNISTASVALEAILHRKRAEDETKKEYVTAAIKVIQKDIGFIEANKRFFEILKIVDLKNYLNYVSTFEPNMWLKVLRIYHSNYLKIG